jgi:hypothetical protein
MPNDAATLFADGMRIVLSFLTLTDAISAVHTCRWWNAQLASERSLGLGWCNRSQKSIERLLASSLRVHISEYVQYHQSAHTSWTQVIATVSRLENLRRMVIAVDDYPVADLQPDVLDALPCRLESLSVSFWNGCGDMSIMDQRRCFAILGRGCASLHTLRVWGLDKSVSLAPLACLNKLHSLDVSHTWMGPSDLSTMVSDVLRQLMPCVSLTSLTRGNAHLKVSDIALDGIHMPQMQRTNMLIQGFASLRGLHDVLPGLVEMRQHTYRVSDIHLLRQWSATLVSLHLGNLDRDAPVYPHTLSAAIGSCAHLTHLQLMNASAFVQCSQWRTIFQELPHLVSLDLVGLCVGSLSFLKYDTRGQLRRLTLCQLALFNDNVTLLCKAHQLQHLVIGLYTFPGIWFKQLVTRLDDTTCTLRGLLSLTIQGQAHKHNDTWCKLSWTGSTRLANDTSRGLVMPVDT